MSNNRISSLDDDNYQDQIFRDSQDDSISQYQLTYSANQLLKFGLKKLLPPSKPQIKIKHVKKQLLLRGKESSCQAYIKKLRQIQQLYTLNKIVFQVEDPPIERIQFEMKEEYKLKIYRPKIVEKTIKKMIEQKIKVAQMKELLQKIFANGDNFVMLICLKQYHEQAIKAIDVINLQQSKIKMSQLQKIKMNQQQQSKPKKKKYVKVQSKKQNIQRQEQIIQLQSRGRQTDSRRPRYAKKQSEKQLNQEHQFIFALMYQRSAFDKEHFSTWVNRNKILSMNHFQIKEKPDHVIISLKKLDERDKQRLDKLEIYIKYQKIITISQQVYESQINPFLAKNHKPPGVSLQFISGYIPSKTAQKDLRRAVKSRLLNKQIKGYIPFYALRFVGLLSQLSRIQRQILQFLSQIEPIHILQKIKVEIPQILIPYINDKPIQDLFLRTIQEDTSFSHMLVEKVEINMNLAVKQIILEINLKTDYKEKLQFILQSYKQILKKKISTHVFTNQITNDIYEKLKESYNFYKIDQGYLLITHFDNIGNQISAIFNLFNNRAAIKQYSITVQKRHSASIIDMFTQFKKISPNIQNLKFFKQEQSHNKDKFTFLGTNEDVMSIQSQIKQYLKQFSQNQASERVQISQIKAHFLKQKGINLLQSITVNQGIVIKVQSSEHMLQIFSKKVFIQIVSGYQFISFMQNNDILCIENEQTLKQIKNPNFDPFLNAYQLQTKNTNYFKILFNRASQKLIKCENSNKNLLISGQDLISNLQKKINDKTNQDLRNKKIFLMMPKNNSKIFLQKLLKSLSKVQQNFKIMIICPDKTRDILLQVPIEQILAKKAQNIWYTTQHEKKVLYSKQACKKIDQGIKNKQNFLLLTNQDLNLFQNTHVYVKKQNSLVHIRSHLTFTVEIKNSKQYYFTIRGESYRMPLSQENKIIQSDKQQVQICIGLYKIDFEKKIQTNVFSGFKRQILCDKIQESALSKIYQHKLKKMMHYLTFNFNKQKANAYQKVKKEINDFLQKKLIKRQVQVSKAFDSLNKQLLKTEAENFNISLGFVPQDKKIIFEAYDEQKTDLFQKFIKSHVQNQIQKTVQVPKTWSPQKNEIQLFQISKDTEQFKSIQANFNPVGPIKKLQRIQNKIIYKKYYDEKKHIQQLNHGKQVKQTMLYHGTRATEPSLIYLDKEQSFNINYTSDHNLLGKGIYFAVNPVYSHNYKYTVKNLIGEESQMFLCRVLVGQSQKMQGSKSNNSIKDTTYKNQAQKLRYQSSTAYLINSDIYVVYKNRRAYPQYLITY